MLIVSLLILLLDVLLVSVGGRFVVKFKMVGTTFVF